jgi:hypothetical protein
LTRFVAALAAGIAGLIVGTLVSLGVFWVAGRVLTSLFAIAALLLAFPAAGFALAFQLVWLRKNRV